MTSRNCICVISGDEISTALYARDGWRAVKENVRWDTGVLVEMKITLDLVWGLEDLLR